MEVLKKQRSTRRSAFTKAFNTLNELISDKGPTADIAVCFQLLEEKSANLDDVMSQVYAAMFADDSIPEDDITKEMEDAEVYKRKFLSVKYSLEQMNAPPVQVSRSVTPVNSSTSAITRRESDVKKAYKLPKIELVQFSGDVREWLRFWSLFEKIHNDEQIDAVDKFQYLIQSMVPGSRAAELVSSFPPTQENYSKVITSLKNRFGQSDLQIEVYVRELLQLVLQNVTKCNGQIPLVTLYDKIESHLRALDSLGVTTKECAAMLFPLVESSLPEELLRVWQRSYSAGSASAAQNNISPNTHSKDRLERLIKFIEGEVQNELRISMATKGFEFKTGDQDVSRARKQKAPANPKELYTATGLFVAGGKERACVFCNSKEHDSENCGKANKMTLTERRECAKKGHVCFNCLRGAHNYKKCRAKLNCKRCDRKHVLIMCPSANQNVNESDAVSAATVVDECSLASLCRDPQVYLQTLRVKIYSDSNESIVRALIDTGSQKSYIAKEVANRMRYHTVGEQQVNHLLFGGGKLDAVPHKKYKARIRSLTRNYSCNFDVLDQEVICGRVPSLGTGKWCRELKEMHIDLSDFCNSDESISLLIGADVAGKLLTGKKHNLPCGLVAIETLLGWTIMGSATNIGEHKEENCVTTALSMFIESCNIKDLWSLDALGIKDPIAHKTHMEEEEELCAAFRKTVKKNAAGRYEVPLPWVDNHPPIGDNKNAAIRRLQATEKKLKATDFFQKYDAVLKGWLNDGIIERVPLEEENTWGHYLPHRAVIKEGSTTAVRPVFDASAKLPPHPSLNECLQKGPNLIAFVPSILLRFREGEFGVISDIAKAFLQISICPSERDFLRFLWFDESGNIVMFRHCRVVFGVCSSPFILATIIDMHLQDIISGSYGNVRVSSMDNVSKLANSFYVDNCVTSVNSSDELVSFISDAKSAMDTAGFDLRGWEYNGDNSTSDRAGVLGLIWDKKRDSLLINVDNIKKMDFASITKRNILSYAYRIFDPLGFVCTVTLIPRLLLQKACLKNNDWDAEVDEEIENAFLKWAEELKDLHQVEVPRCIMGKIDENASISLHTFCDASKLAYAAVTFLRVETTAGVKVGFVQAKSRVAPIKNENESRHSIPRLELLAAIIGVRMTASILSSMNLKNVSVHFWSDSSTVLAWIYRDNNWGVFVYNRIKEIRQLSSPSQWKHVPGVMNPADLPSRGCTVQQLVSSKWWEGPEWLKGPQVDWPSSTNSFDEAEINSELKKSARNESSRISLVCLLRVDTKSNSEFLERFSDYDRIIRIIAWIKRFSNNFRSAVKLRKEGNAQAKALKLNSKKECLRVKELENAEIIIIKMIQTESFGNAENETFSHLEPFTDEQGLIRLKSKILLREDSYNFRLPIILPRKHFIVTLIIRKFHENLNHAGTQITLNNLREKFWILGGRKTIRAVIKKCVTCRRFDAQPLGAAPAPLPVNRIRDAAVFEVVGIDFAGPLYLKGGKKSWVCIFTCAVYRAVNLQLVSSLDVGSFMMALRRHIEQRGRPSVIYSDNGTNFSGLNNLFKRINYEELANTTASTEKIEWIFNPPSAAWWGGFWERLIGILKKLLRRTLKKSCLDYEEMSTVLADCCAIINSRPITFMSDGKDELEPLTPSHFLREIKEYGVIDLDRIEECDLKKKYVHQLMLKKALRQRFRSEYLGALTHQKRKSNTVNDLKEGDIVLIGNDNSKRLDWPLAKVKKLIVGNDGNVRVARLTTSTGELVRPIQRLYPLELNAGVSELAEEETVREKCREKAISRKKIVLSENEGIDDSVPVKTRSGREVKRPDRLAYN